MNNWKEILIKWRKNYSERPNGLQILVRKGIPEALRGEVWQLLSGSVQNEKEMIDTYRLLLTKESSRNQLIHNNFYYPIYLLSRIHSPYSNNMNLSKKNVCSIKSSTSTSSWST